MAVRSCTKVSGHKMGFVVDEALKFGPTDQSTMDIGTTTWQTEEAG